MKHGTRISLSNAFSNNFIKPLEIGDEGVIVADYGGTDTCDGLIEIETNPRYKVKFDKDEVNTCDGAYPFLFKKSELIALNIATQKEG
jgi:hypothetical protein